MSKVLVVEDSITQREIIVALLQDSGLTVVSASSGTEALEQIQVHCPDLVLLDIVMPKMNGYEVCRRLKADPKTKNVPVVMCSSKSEESVIFTVANVCPACVILGDRRDIYNAHSCASSHGLG